jgi:hypothetical protein
MSGLQNSPAPQLTTITRCDLKEELPINCDPFESHQASLEPLRAPC